MKPNCSKHIVPEYLQDLRQVAIDIADMPYDKLMDFFHFLSLKIRQDGDKDIAGGRDQLGIELNKLATEINGARFITEKIWNICEPYMRKKEENEKWKKEE